MTTRGSFRFVTTWRDRRSRGVDFVGRDRGQVDLVVASPLTRALQTATAVARILGTARDG